MGDAAKQLHQLFDEDWQWRLNEYPESATYLGVHRYNDRLTDLTFEAIERRKAHEREMLSRIKKISKEELSGQDVLSYELFLYDKQIEIEGQKFPSECIGLINQMEGPHINFPHLVDAMPFRNVKDYENYLSRLAAYPHYIEHIIALLKRGIETKWVLPAVPLRSIPKQIEDLVNTELTENPLFRPFLNFQQDIDESARTKLMSEGKNAIAQSFMPAMKKLLAFIKDIYLPSCSQTIAASSLPDGAAYYQYLVNYHTTTSLTPKEIFEIGKNEVARIRKEMDTVMKQVGFKGSLQEFAEFLRTDSRFYFTQPEDLVRAYRDIAKRADPELTKLFTELPRTPYGIREIPAFEAPSQITAYYIPSASDGSRPGYFWVNTHDLKTRPTYEMETLALHEAVPGHHLQIARAQELKSLPEFRRNGGYTAYIEGWGLYAETLGYEMGFFTDPYFKFGQLSYEMLRSCRLVVDVGIHALGWSREQAINFMKENTVNPDNDTIIEIDRYIVIPGQALAYKIGELKIKELRARAKKQLGENFDVRRFHNALLDNGALPLDVLEMMINQWVLAEKSRYT